jgi:hypothetical protein
MCEGVKALMISYHTALQEEDTDKSVFAVVSNLSERRNVNIYLIQKRNTNGKT